MCDMQKRPNAKSKSGEPSELGGLMKAPQGDPINPTQRSLVRKLESNGEGLPIDLNAFLRGSSVSLRDVLAEIKEMVDPGYAAEIDVQETITFTEEDV